MSLNAISDDAPQPRLCHIIKWPDFDGYGFHLHAEKHKVGQFIGKVDEGSPAEAAGLRKGDRIVEVNGSNIAQENHKQVVERIKFVRDETKLLVVDEGTDAWYKEHDIVIKGTLESVLHLKTPPRSSPSDIGEPESDDDNANENGQMRPSSSPATSGKLSMNNNEDKSGRSTPQSPYKDDSDHRSLSKASSHDANDSPVAGSRGSVDRMSSSGSTKSANDAPSPSPPLRNANGNGTSPANGHHANTGNQHLRPTSMPVSPSSASNSANGLNLNMTVQEMRAKLALRKKYDPKKDSMDIKKKHEIIQGM